MQNLTAKASQRVLRPESRSIVMEYILNEYCNEQYLLVNTRYKSDLA
jgi:hypothetical protein